MIPDDFETLILRIKASTSIAVTSSKLKLLSSSFGERFWDIGLFGSLSEI